MPYLIYGLWIILAILLIAFLASNIVIVPQAKAYIVERLGTYKCTWNTGLHIKVPLFERGCPEGNFERAGSGLSTAAGYHER